MVKPEGRRGSLSHASRIIIMEDIYSNSLQKYLTFFVDSLVNLEFSDHPHSNKTDEEWRELFRKNGLKLVDAKYHRFLLFFRQVTYYLEKENPYLLPKP